MTGGEYTDSVGPGTALHIDKGTQPDHAVCRGQLKGSEYIDIVPEGKDLEWHYRPRTAAASYEETGGLVSFTPVTQELAFKVPVYGSSPDVVNTMPWEYRMPWDGWLHVDVYLKGAWAAGPAMDLTLWVLNHSSGLAREADCSLGVGPEAASFKLQAGMQVLFNADEILRIRLTSTQPGSVVSYEGYVDVFYTHEPEL